MKAAGRATPPESTLVKDIADVLQENVTAILTNALSLCHLSQEKVTMRLLYDVIMSAPSAEDVETYAGLMSTGTTYARIYHAAGEYEFKCRCAYEDNISPELRAAVDRQEEEATEKYIRGMRVPENVEFQRADKFFGLEYAPLDATMRQMLNLACAGVLLSWLQEPVFSSLCGDQENAASMTLEQKMAQVLDTGQITRYLEAKN